MLLDNNCGSEPNIHIDQKMKVKRRCLKQMKKSSGEIYNMSSTNSLSSLLLSGNRGIGGVTWGESSSLDLYDLEDDNDDENTKGSY